MLNLYIYREAAPNTVSVCISKSHFLVRPQIKPNIIYISYNFIVQFQLLNNHTLTSLATPEPGDERMKG